MRFYTFQVILDNVLLFEGCGNGSNALEAFENQVACGAITLPDNYQVTVIAAGQNGVGFRFEAYKL